jgi:hypothetical protein
LMIPKLEVYKHDEYTNRNNKPVYLAHFKDYTKITYANFRVFIPESLIKNSTIVVEPNKGGAVQTEAIKVANIEYHNLLNFYKLAGKSYESYSYSSEEII